MTDKEIEDAVKSFTKNEPHKSNRHRYHSEVCFPFFFSSMNTSDVCVGLKNKKRGGKEEEQHKTQGELQEVKEG